jgi:hypothetical protein
MVVKLHRKRALPLQQGHGALYGLHRIAWVDGVDLNLPLLNVPLNRSIMRPSFAVPRASFSQTALD